MKKLVTTGLAGSIAICLTTILTLTATLWSGSIYAQDCVMVCPPAIPPVQVSVSADCQDTLDYLDLDVQVIDCPGEITLDIIENGVSIGNVITIGMAGNTYMVIISNPATGQSCMTAIMVIDGQAPVLTCPADITFECTADLDLYNGLDSTDILDCSETVVSFIDELVSPPVNCDSNIISQFLRTYIVRDIFNNADSCEQLISLEKASLDDVIFPPNWTGIDFLDCFPLPDTTPANLGIPTVGDDPIINGSFCNLSAIYTDIIVPICSGSYKILRTWTVFDWCEGNLSIDSTQVIEILDITGPNVQAPIDMTVSASSSECNADVIVAPAVITEDCSDSWTVRMQGAFGTINSNGGLIQDLPVGIHTIIFIATNDCGIEGADTMLLTIEDLQPPVPVCHQSLAVPLSNDGTAIIPAAAFNAASLDNCATIYFKVRRMSAPIGYSCPNPGNPQYLFDDFIQFCCEDIENNEIMVVLRVYDLPPVPGPVSDTYLAGHFNDCMVQVEVQDKLPPQITCPSNLTISCEFPFTEENLDVFGSVVTDPLDQDSICIDDPGAPGDPGLVCVGIDGLALDNCNVDISSTAFIDINNCGVGTIIRTFTATDDGGRQATCQQIISVINYDLFGLSDILWPLDYTTSNICEIDLLDPEDLLPPFNEPVLTSGPCDLVASTYEDMVFDFTNDDQACFKILRTWTVIDWCQINSQTGGIWTHIQVIKVMNTIGPVIEPIEDITECSFDPACGGLTLSFEANASDDCSGPASLTWRYSIDIDNNGSFDFISGAITGETIQFSRDLPIGTHRILYTVWDQCGNITNEEQNVTIESCKAPSAKCIHGLSTNLMPMDLDGDGIADWGMVTIFAEMFDAGSDHPCGNDVSVAFSADPLDIVRVFDCSDLGINEIELWAIDENGLTDFCITYLDVQDNTGVCPPEPGQSGIISGIISVPNSGKLEGVEIFLEGSNMESIQSGSNGYFIFPSMPLGGEYEVKPARTGDAKNGVTTLDLVKIQKHLLGLESFSTPYQYIAADANNSESITAIDIIHLRKLILGYYTELPSNQSWRFIDQGHIFPDPANPWLSVWPETYMISPFTGSMNEVNFDAVKVGDLNLSAHLHANGGSIILPRSPVKCEIEYVVQKEEADDIFKIEIYIKDAQLYNAVQFSFDWNKLGYELVDWNPGEQFPSDNIRMPESKEGIASVAAYTLEDWPSNSLHIMNLWVKPVSTNPGPFKLYLKQGPTDPVGYLKSNEQPVGINLSGKHTSLPQVYNRPNPFKDRTTILYHSAMEEKAQMKFYDMNGRVVLSRNVHLWKGENEFIVNSSELTGSGIYIYEIESAHQHSTNRMIIVE